MNDYVPELLSYDSDRLIRQWRDRYSTGWLYVHHSLDNRESQETP